MFSLISNFDLISLLKFLLQDPQVLVQAIVTLYTPNDTLAMEHSMASGPEPKHVDRKMLYVSLEERIKYLHDFLDFNAGKLFPSPDT